MSISYQDNTRTFLNKLSIFLIIPNETITILNFSLDFVGHAPKLKKKKAKYKDFYEKIQHHLHAFA